MWPSGAVVSPWAWSVRRIPSWDLPDQILVLFPVPLSPWPPSWHVRVTTQSHVSQPSPSHVSPYQAWRRSAAVNQEDLFVGRGRDSDLFSLPSLTIIMKIHSGLIPWQIMTGARGLKEWTVTWHWQSLGFDGRWELISTFLKNCSPTVSK